MINGIIAIIMDSILKSLTNKFRFLDIVVLVPLDDINNAVHVDCVYAHIEDAGQSKNLPFLMYIQTTVLILLSTEWILVLNICWDKSKP